MRREDRHVIATAALDYAGSPFAPIVTVVETWLHERPGLFERNTTLRAAIGRVIRADGGDAAPSAAERRRFFDSVAQLFRIAADDAPVTLIIDDVHNADPATLHLLYHILEAVREHRFFLLASCRPGADGERGEPWLRSSRLDRLPQVGTVDLAPLDDDASATLIRQAAGGRLDKLTRSRIAVGAEGNPLFAEELVRQAIETGNSDCPVPRSVAEAVLDRFRLLSQGARECLRAAACLGRDFEDGLVARMTHRPLTEVHAALRAALNLGLVDETADANVFRFHHALTREAIYDDMLQAERRVAHRRIFALFEALPHTVDRIAALAFQAYAANDRQATAYYNELAGDHAFASRAFESAIEHWLRALEAIGDRAAAVSVAQKVANAWLAAGFPDRAVKPARDALSYYREHGEVESIARMLLLLADVAAQTGDDEKRLELMAEASAALANVPSSRLQAKRSVCESEIALANHNVAGAMSATSNALDAADLDLGDTIALRNARAHALLMERRYRDAIEVQSQTVRIAIERGAADHLWETRFGLGIICALSGERARAADAFGASAADASARLAMTERALSIAHQAEMELIGGNVAVARTLLDDALPDAARRDNPALTVEVGRVGLFLGVRTEDATLVRRIVEVLELNALFARETPERFFPLSGAYAQYLVGEGRQDAARDVLRRAVRRLSAKRLRSTDWSVCSMMTVAAIGDEADIPRARRQVAGWFAPYAPAFVSLFDAFVAERLGQADEAAAMAERAVPGFASFGFRYEEGLALSLAGRKIEALQVFKEFGARPDVRRVRDALTPRNRQGRPANELTAREAEVAHLVAAGLRNRTISERLNVSEKTVETHLASIFGKLSVKSRAEIAGRLEALRADAV